MPGAMLYAKLAPMASGVASLTRREREVFDLLVLGHTNREIADVMHLSARTVEFHRASIQSKLGLRARSELVRFALEHGLFEAWRKPR